MLRIKGAVAPTDAAAFLASLGTAPVMIKQRVGLVRVLLVTWSVIMKRKSSPSADRLGRCPIAGSSSESRTLRVSQAGFTLAEVMVATAILALSIVGVTQSLLLLNRHAAVIRVMNAAKAEALSRTQRVAQCSYVPDTTPAVIPSILVVGTTIETIDLGSTATDLGSIPATVTWVVTNISPTTNVRSVRCTITCKYLTRNLSYELLTYKSPD